MRQRCGTNQRVSRSLLLPLCDPLAASSSSSRSAIKPSLQVDAVGEVGSSDSAMAAPLLQVNHLFRRLSWWHPIEEGCKLPLTRSYAKCAALPPDVSVIGWCDLEVSGQIQARA